MNQTEPARRAIAQRYLDVLAALAPPESLLDVRYRADDGDFARFFVAMHAPAAARIVQIGQRTDIYVGVAPRHRRSGHREDLAPTALVWVDCDSHEASDALASFIPAPSMIIASGSDGHAHGYWALTQTMTVAQVKNLNHRLALMIGADTSAVIEPTAILRVPGTMNHKEQPPRPVQLHRCAGRRYTLAELTAAAPPLPIEQSCDTNQNDSYVVGSARPNEHDPLLEIPPAHYVSVLLGEQPGPNHKILCPFHDDHDPSFHVYASAEEGWTCFGCKTSNGKRLGGDIYKLASLLWAIPTSGASFLELRSRLDETFGVARQRPRVDRMSPKK